MHETIKPSFFVRPDRSQKAYCSHCGKPVLQDLYNLSQHMQKCSTSLSWIERILETDSYFYTLSKTDGNELQFTIWRPAMIRNPRNQSIYTHGKWESVYNAFFKPNSREVRQEGMSSLWSWLYLIDQKKVTRLNHIEDADVIREVFTTVPDIADLTMFCHLYEMKGYKQIPVSLTDDFRKQHCTLREEEKNMFITLANRHCVQVFGEYTQLDGHPVLAMRFYLSSVYYSTNEFHYAVIGDGILLHDNVHCSLREIWRNHFLFHMDKETVEQFSDACPSFGIRNYLNNCGMNILIPLFAAGNYHKGIELLAKGGLSYYADHYYQFNNELHYFEQEPYPTEYTNASELLHLPKAILRTANPSVMNDPKARERFSYIYEKDRPLVEGIQLNRYVLQFLLSHDVLHDHSVRRNAIPGIARLTRQELRKMLLYISNLSYEEWRYYEDYLHLKHTTGIHTFGLFPDDIILAHDNLSSQLRIAENAEKEMLFQKAVASYKHLASDPQSDHEYIVICPCSIEDLYQEGRTQHNCVASYTDRVIHGSSHILFMRSTAKPNQSLITIEVQKGSLIQAKARYNRQADEDMQKEIILWCREKGISFMSCIDLLLSLRTKEAIDRMSDHS